MAKRFRDVCHLPENEKQWIAGKGGGFVVRDPPHLPWTIDKLRAIPPFEFENWAVIALGGVHNKVVAAAPQQLARVVRPTGSFYYHCDWRASQL